MSNWAKNNFLNAVKNSSSIGETLNNLGLKKTGGNYKTYHKYVKNYGVNTSHFLNQHNLGRLGVKGRRAPYKEMLVTNSSYDTGYIKRRIIEENLLENRCHGKDCMIICTWLDKNITLHLDHINGINSDNRIENLRFLCPNCHSQTDTYCGKNAKRVKNKKPGCKSCDKEVKSFKSIKCKECSKYREFKIQWPTNIELLKELETKSYSQLGRELGVSDNAIRKHLRRGSTRT